MRWMVALALVACGHAVNASRLSPGVVAIQCRSGLQGCRERAVALCPDGYDLVDAQGAPASASTYVGEMFVHCRGPLVPEALGYRDCMADASCERGDKCVWSRDEGGDTGRCISAPVTR